MACAFAAIVIVGSITGASLKQDKQKSEVGLSSSQHIQHQMASRCRSRRCETDLNLGYPTV